jgi:hypothetical protein
MQMKKLQVITERFVVNNIQWLLSFFLVLQLLLPTNFTYVKFDSQTGNWREKLAIKHLKSSLTKEVSKFCSVQ